MDQATRKSKNNAESIIFTSTFVISKSMQVKQWIPRNHRICSNHNDFSRNSHDELDIMGWGEALSEPYRSPVGVEAQLACESSTSKLWKRVACIALKKLEVLTSSKISPSRICRLRGVTAPHPFQKWAINACGAIYSMSRYNWSMSWVETVIHKS